MLSILNKIFLLFFLASCNQTKQLKTIDGDDLVPNHPPFWAYFTIKGIDSDGDGIRDDVELWINDEFDDVNVRKALKWRAKTMISFMWVKNQYEAKMNMEYEKLAENCLLFVSAFEKDGKIKIRNTNNIWDKVLNNYWRKYQYNRAGRFVPSGIYNSGSLNKVVQFTSCDFEIVNLRNLINLYARNRIFTEDDQAFFSEMSKGLE